MAPCTLLYKNRRNRRSRGTEPATYRDAVLDFDIIMNEDFIPTTILTKIR